MWEPRKNSNCDESVWFIYHLKGRRTGATPRPQRPIQSHVTYHYKLSQVRTSRAIKWDTETYCGSGWSCHYASIDLLGQEESLWLYGEHDWVSGVRSPPRPAANFLVGKVVTGCPISHKKSLNNVINSFQSSVSPKSHERLPGIRFTCWLTSDCKGLHGSNLKGLKPK